MVTLAAIMTAWRRGGIYSPYYWFVLAAAYPLLSPFLIQDLLGFPYFSYFARDMQDAQALGVPILVGALASLFLALTVRETGHGSRLAIEANKGRPRIGKKSAFLLIVLSAPLILFFAWLAEPGQIVGLADYQTLREQRIGGARFAGGAWLLFEIVALSGYLRLRNEKGASKRLGSYMFWTTTLFSFIWLFLHARRSETLGFAILLFCMLRPQLQYASSRWPQWLNQRVVILLLILVGFSLIGYFRGTLDWSSLNRPDYVQAPGGSGNNLLTYIAAYHLKAKEWLNIYPGETYWYYMVNLPPEMLGFSRAPTAYDLVEEQVNLMGGQYWLMEPVMNAGGIGIAVFAGMLAWLLSWSIRGLLLFQSGRCRPHRFLQSAMFIALIFRTMWYGPDAAINGFIMALVVGMALNWAFIAGQPKYRGVHGK
ncbi:hypothetical protein NOC27_1684 [Nitrosococcus oceani AFC27]|nr:hypothetical protein NOC27_1684 [Nitrosococcus oceani AFC27]GEM21041.1 hypothetical protein NONS58_24700 [Nitrosococcus oceani]